MKKLSQKPPHLPASRVVHNNAGSSALQGNGFSVVIVESTAKRPKTVADIAAAKQRHYRRSRQHRRDPFKTLNHDIIVLILRYLQPVDFIRLRRTSKLWKAVIELHTGRAYLAKEFPSSAVPRTIKINDGLSKEEAEAEYQYMCHLEFRRICELSCSVAMWTVNSSHTFCFIRITNFCCSPSLPPSKLSSQYGKSGIQYHWGERLAPQQSLPGSYRSKDDLGPQF